MLHSKTMVIDDRLSMIGSINLDPLSLIDDATMAGALAATFLDDCGRAKRQTA